MIYKILLPGAVLTAVLLGFFAQGAYAMDKGKQSFPFQLTEEQWRERLTKEEYKVLRDEGTEKSCSSPLLGVKGDGKFYCNGCGHLLFDTTSKFDSGTGWPSFYEPVDDNAVGTSTDYKIGVARTEVHCANCGSHLGHVFKDGPPPTGLRYCMNGIALDFVQENSDHDHTDHNHE